MQFSIKELRARMNETQEQVANAVGVSKQTYCLWERNISNVSVSKVKALAEHFDVTLNQIKF